MYIPGSEMHSDDLKELIGENYVLEDHIVDRLEFTATKVKLKYVK